MRIAIVTDAWTPQVNGVVTTLGKSRGRRYRPSATAGAELEGLACGILRGKTALMSVIEQSEPGRSHHWLAVPTLVLSLAGLVLAFVEMIALFLGAGGSGVDALLSLLGWLLLPITLLGLACLAMLEETGQGRIATCWSRLPAWLVILLGVLLVIAMLAELAIWLVELAGGGSVPLGHYVPIVAVILFSMAFTTAYALIAPTGAGGKHRGPVRHPDPVRRDMD